MVLWRKHLYTKIHLSSGYGKIYEKSTQRSELFHYFNVFPNSVREAFSFITSADYDHDKLKIRCEDERDKGYDNYVLFCSTCSKDKYPDFIKKFKDHLFAWKPKDWGYSGTLGWTHHCCTVTQDHDFCGCIIPNDPSVIAGPNDRRLFFVQLNTLINTTIRKKLSYLENVLLQLKRKIL